MNCSVAIIGAGMAGLSAARALHAAGLGVQLFDKSRGSGGRLSSRHSETGSLDLGAQYFTARDPDFALEVQHWHSRGWVKAWSPALYSYRDGQLKASADTQTRWVGTPRMSALTRALVGQLPLQSACRISRLSRRQQQWRLYDQAGHEHGPFDHLILAIPAPQATALINSISGLAAATAGVAMQPTWAVALGYERPLPTPVEACFIQDQRLAWVARNSSKPGRTGQLDTWILHASDAWSDRHRDLPATAVFEQLTHTLAAVLGTSLPGPTLALAHRWLYARPAKVQNWGALTDDSLSLQLCGDWCLSGRVEDAWRSGQVAARRLLVQSEPEKRR